MTGRGIPDEAKAAKIILKDFCNGKLLFNCVWPDYDPVVHGEMNQTNLTPL